MIYEENLSHKKLENALFAQPGAEYRAAPFWAWNCELEREELLRQIRIFKEMGFGGFHMHVRTGMATPYLSDAFMDLIRDCTDYAEKQEMLAWLYDEDRWASGAAGGIVTKDPAFRQRSLVFSPDAIAYDRTRDPVLLRRFDIVLDEEKTLASYRILQDGEEAAGTLWYAYRMLESPSAWFNGQTYLDTLNPKAVQRFLEVTHERYAEKVGDRFGKTIPAIFTDEPQFSRKQTLPFADSKQTVSLPWTDDLDDTYQKTYGTSLLDHLPELFWELPNGVPSVIRYHYHDHVCDRFTQAFADQCGAWCEKHGILLTGHMMEEDTLRTQTGALGEAMRSYRAFQLPGIDMLCARWEITTAKQAQSAVHQYGRRGMISELYGVTNWNFDFRGHKLHGDWQAALGVTVRVPHLSWVSMKGEAKRDYPASISYQSSYYPEYRYVEDHFARVNTALTRGKPMVRIGVIHPVESYWLHFGPAEQTALIRHQLDTNFRNLTEWLLYGSLDFDFISEALLPSQCAQGGAPLRVGEMAYDVIIVPGCETLRTTTYERLEAFAKAGGHLILLGDAPKYEGACISNRGQALCKVAQQISFLRAPLLDALLPYRTLELRNMDGTYTENLFHQLRRDNNGVWLFLAHGKEPRNPDISEKQRIQIRLRGTFFPQLYHTITGEILTVPAKREGGFTHLSLELYDYDSALLYFADQEEILPAKVQPTYGAPISLPVPKTVSYKLSEPNVYLLDKAQLALDNDDFSEETEILRGDNALRVKLGLPRRNSSVVQPYILGKQTPTHTATMKFSFVCDFAVVGAEFALEDADVATISCNGEAVSTVDHGYYIDRCIRKVALPPLHVGKNVITVTVPFGERTNLEACYLLGDFNVAVAGETRLIVPAKPTLAFGDLTVQGLAHFGGAVTYKIPVSLPQSGTLTVRIPHYVASVLTVSLDGKKQATVAYPPYLAAIPDVSAGDHLVEITAFLSRYNCLSPLHLADQKLDWIGPNAWRTTADAWTECYRLIPAGLTSAPQITLYPINRTDTL